MVCYNLYFYELLWGEWDKREAKALYYIVTAGLMTYLLISDLYKSTALTFQINFISKITIIINFALFSLILYNILAHPVLYLFILNGLVFALSIMIATSGIRHGMFKI